MAASDSAPLARDAPSIDPLGSPALQKLFRDAWEADQPPEHLRPVLAATHWRPAPPIIGACSWW